MVQTTITSVDLIDTNSGHVAFSNIKKQIALIDVEIEHVLTALPSAINDGLSENLALEAMEYLKQLQLLSSQMRKTHLKAHAKFRTGIETAPLESSFSGRAPT